MSFLDSLSAHPLLPAVVHDKAVGAIVGSALGDCIGLYTEFLPKTESEKAYPERRFSLVAPITHFREDSHRDKFEPASWTDDTDHALLLILSYIHHDGKIEPLDFAARLQSWISQGLRSLDRLPLGLGRTVGRVAMDSSFTTKPQAVALQAWLTSSRRAAANGSLMRTHPVGIMCIDKTQEETFQLAATFSVLTHTDPRCVISCCLATALLRGLLRGEILREADIDTLIEQAYAWMVSQPSLINPAPEPTPTDTLPIEPFSKEEYLRHACAQSMADLELDDSQKMGYVYKCLGAAVLTLRLAMRAAESAGYLSSRPVIFEQLITDLVMQGGDADTNACAAGALLGAWTGYASLPAHWVTGIMHKEWLVRKAEVMSRIAGIVEDGTVLVVQADRKDTAIDGGRGILDQSALEQRERQLVEKVLLKSKERREREERDRRAAKEGPVKWFKGLTGMGGN